MNLFLERVEEKKKGGGALSLDPFLTKKIEEVG